MSQDRGATGGAGQLVATLVGLAVLGFVGYRFGPGLWQRIQGKKPAAPTSELARYEHDHVTSRFSLKVHEGGRTTLEGWVQNSGPRPIYGLRVRLSSAAFGGQVIELGDLPARQKRTYSEPLGQAPLRGRGGYQRYQVDAFRYGRVEFSLTPRTGQEDPPE